MRNGYTVHFYVAAVLGLALTSGQARAEESLRIAVAQVKTKLTISGAGLEVVDPAVGRVLHSGSPVLVAPSRKGVIVNGELIAATKLEVRGRDTVRVRDLTLTDGVELFSLMRGNRALLVVVHTVPIEAYVAATVSSEAPGSWPIEALKAQAVASRSFAVYRKFHAPDRPYHMEAGVIDQVYGGAKVHPRSQQATRATAGEVLTFRRRPIKAYFHSCCAGHTESAREGWGQNLSYMPGVVCRYDKACPAQKFSARVPMADLIAALRKARLRVSRVDAVRIVKRTSTGRVAKMVLDTDQGAVDLSGEDLRRLVGYGVIKSRHFEARLEDDFLSVQGQGSGHGVGLCQWGMRGMSLKGKSYDQILLHYYPKTRLMRMY